MLRQFEANHLFQSISGSKAMLWNFQSVKCFDKHVELYDIRKSGGQEAEFQERICKNEHACSVDSRSGGSFRGF